MKVHEQRDKLAETIELVLGFLRTGPPLSAFGIAREDCALAHIDYFGDVDGAIGLLCGALAETRGAESHVLIREIHEAVGRTERPCDIGEDVARQKHRAAYTNVKEWVDPSS